MYGEVKKEVREIIKVLCKYQGIEIAEGNVCIDHTVGRDEEKIRAYKKSK